MYFQTSGRNSGIPGFTVCHTQCSVINSWYDETRDTCSSREEISEEVQSIVTSVGVLILADEADL